ncbi:MAG: FtsH protease activity modulator HflK [Henriciella sp.]|jgi:membrane protease subunit HflK|mmetsp:Transcript_29653/g.38113  ORF Transcript_29653/g.38113 Transcript_29653/m.38113 type:complete len:376 (-) Transcript_29653:927-2054(-)
MPWNDNSGNGDEPPKANGGPWGSGGSGGNGDGGSPWGRPGGGGQGGGSDIEDQMRKMQERFSRRGRGGGGGGRGGPNLGPGGFLVLGVVAAIAWLATGVVIVDEGERAAVFRFGEYQKNFAPGLHVHLPAPIETHEVLPSERQQETQIGINQGESLMLTGDENIVDVQFRVFWYYDGENPQDFILNIDNGTPLVKAAAESVMREVVGKSTLDAVLTTGRGEIATIVRDQLQELLADYGAGVQIENVEIQEALAPAPVRADFIDVINAGQDAERLVQEANRYANDIVPRARGEAQQILQDAQAYRDRVIADATGEADRFIQILLEYRKAPQVTRERMYLETMERVLNRTDKLILDSNSGAVPYLPLDRVNRSGGGN